MASSKSRPSISLGDHLFDRLGRHAQPAQRICVALSGGVDSMVLLHATHFACRQMGVMLVATHVNHGLSSNAGEWEKFCSIACARMSIPLDIRRVVVISDGVGVEAGARNARYAALENNDCDWILLGHHQGDQAETLLQNLLRGAGVIGAAGMSERRGRFLRPLLNISRAEILSYAHEHKLSWIEDESNGDARYSRNYLRHKVLPLLESSWQGAGANLARAAATFGETARLLEQVAADDFGAGKLLGVARLRALSPERGLNLLAYYLRQHGLQVPSRATLLEMLRQLVTAGCDSEICFHVGKYQIRRFRECVWIDPVPAVANVVQWNGETPVAWAGYSIRTKTVPGEGIDAASLSGKETYFSPRKNGAVMRLSENTPRRPLKDLLREAGIPPWRRKTLPMLYAGDDLVWAAGVGVDLEYRCKPGAEGVLIEFDGVTW